MFSRMTVPSVHKKSIKVVAIDVTSLMDKRTRIENFLGKNTISHVEADRTGGEMQ